MPCWTCSLDFSKRLLNPAWWLTAGHGRDSPNAKIYLTTSALHRAERRYKQLISKHDCNLAIQQVSEARPTWICSIKPHR
jgi:hypothetical protein